MFSVLNARIDTLQTEQDNQLHMDGLFGDFCKTMKEEMNRYLNPKRILTGRTVRNKRRRTKKPWWCDDLTHLWNEMCMRRKNGLEHREEENGSIGKFFLAKRKVFDKMVQKAKRHHWRHLQNDLIESCENDDTEFWKKIGRLGIGFERRKVIPFEIARDDGSLSNSLDDILCKWKKSF